jgi:hypothetical protein
MAPRLPLPLAALPGTYLGAATYLGLPHVELPAPLAAALLAIGNFGWHRRDLVRTTSNGLVAPFEELDEADRVAPSR